MERIIIIPLYKVHMLTKHGIPKTQSEQRVKAEDHKEVQNLVNYLCTQCHSGYSTTEDLKSHALAVHEMHLCRTCLFYGASESELNSHVKAVHHGRAEQEAAGDQYIKYLCTQCHSGYSTTEEMKSHVLFEHEKHLCRICLFTGASLLELNSHNEAVHPGKAEQEVVGDQQVQTLFLTEVIFRLIGMLAFRDRLADSSATQGRLPLFLFPPGFAFNCQNHRPRSRVRSRNPGSMQVIGQLQALNHIYQQHIDRFELWPILIPTM